MCLAVPMQIKSIAGETALCEIADVSREINIALIDAEPGDWIIVHAGFAIEKLDEEEAQKTLAAFEELSRIENKGTES